MPYSTASNTLYRRTYLARKRGILPPFKANPKPSYLQHRKTYCKKFGLTLEDWDRLFELQGGVCAICGDSPDGRNLSLDHNHTTNKARGLLCQNCNAMLGHSRDSVALLLRGADYLKSYE